jgi:hypothetical protein
MGTTLDIAHLYHEYCVEMFMTRIAYIAFGLALIAVGLLAIHSGHINVSALFSRYHSGSSLAQQSIFFG